MGCVRAVGCEHIDMNYRRVRWEFCRERGGKKGLNLQSLCGVRGLWETLKSYGEAPMGASERGGGNKGCRPSYVEIGWGGTKTLRARLWCVCSGTNSIYTTIR